MNAAKSLIGLAVGVAMVTLGALSWGVGSGVEIPLMAMKPHPGANGTAVIGDESISVRADGLKPNSVYTVWFVNMKPKKQEAGAGTAPYMFRTDSTGAGAYSAQLADSPFGSWQMLMIVLHPDGDPANMKDMVGALSAEIPKAK